LQPVDYQQVLQHWQICSKNEKLKFRMYEQTTEKRPQGQYRLAQGSALGRSVATRQRPARAASFKLLRATVLPLQGVVPLVPYNPGRYPGLGDDWPYRPLNTTSETSMKNIYRRMQGLFLCLEIGA